MCGSGAFHKPEQLARLIEVSKNDPRGERRATQVCQKQSHHGLKPVLCPRHILLQFQHGQLACPWHEFGSATITSAGLRTLNGSASFQPVCLEIDWRIHEYLDSRHVDVRRYVFHTPRSLLCPFEAIIPHKYWGFLGLHTYIRAT